MNHGYIFGARLLDFPTHFLTNRAALRAPRLKRVQVQCGQLRLMALDAALDEEHGAPVASAITGKLYSRLKRRGRNAHRR